jgi:CRISPR-associated protein Cmr6
MPERAVGAPRYFNDGVTFHLYDAFPAAETLGKQREIYNACSTDQGLRFTKYFGRWSQAESIELLNEVKKETPFRRDNGPTYQKKETLHAEPVLDWLNPSGQAGERKSARNETLIVGDQPRLTEAARRMEKLTISRGRFFELSLVSRLLTGIGLPHPTDNGFLFHPTLAVPYLRGTALKQVARSSAIDEIGLGDDDLNRLFGAVNEKGEPSGSSGALVFLDALPLKPVTLTAEQITSHYPDYYGGPDPSAGTMGPDRKEPADWYEPNPVTLLAVDASHDRPLSFQFAILAASSIDKDIKNAEGWLRDGLERSGLGAKTTLGYGRFMTEGRRQQLLNHIEQTEDADWVPAIGEQVLCDNAIAVVTAHLPGNRVRLSSLEERYEFEEDISELKRRK